jgi:hypothetical protein
MDLWSSTIPLGKVKADLHRIHVLNNVAFPYNDPILHGVVCFACSFCICFCNASVAPLSR